MYQSGTWYGPSVDFDANKDTDILQIQRNTKGKRVT